MVIRASRAEELRASVDQRIQTLEGEIRVLKAERNALAPISCLPPEVLVHIFMLVRDTSSEIIRALPCLGQVCKLWRSTALNSAVLWSVVDCTRGEWTKETLRRAGAAPLHLTRRNFLFGNEARNVLSVALGELPRAKTFSFPRLPSTTMDASDEVWPTGAPLLESFSLDSEKLHRIPDHFTNGAFPKLRHVKMTNCEFHWSMSFLRNLTHLEVTNGDSWSGIAYPSVKSLLSMLSELEELRNLRLVIDEFGSISHNEQPPPVVTTGLVRANLPHLEVLELGLYTNMVTALLQHLPHPQDRLVVSCELGPPDVQNVLMVCIQAFYSFQLGKGKRMEAAHIGAWSMRDLYLWDTPDYVTIGGNYDAILKLSLRLDDVNPIDYFALVGPLLLRETKYITVDGFRDLFLAGIYLPNCSIVCILRQDLNFTSDLPQPVIFHLFDGSPRLPSLKVLAFSHVHFSILPKTSKSLSRLTVPRFVASLKAITPWYSRLVFLDCHDFPDAQFAKLRRTTTIRTVKSPRIMGTIESFDLIIKDFAEGA